jgi:hypothetical protein
MGRPRKSPAVKWDKVKGVTGTIVRFKIDTPKEKLTEFFKGKKYKFLYVGIYDDVLYRYFVVEK